MSSNGHHHPTEEIKELARAMTQAFLETVQQNFAASSDALATMAAVFQEARAMIRSEVPPSRQLTAEDLCDILEWLAGALSKGDSPTDA